MPPSTLLKKPALHGLIVVTSGKGGVAKTSSAAAIAAGLTQIGARVDFMIDLDYGTSLTRSNGYSPSAPMSQQLLDGEISLEDAQRATKDEIPIVPATVGLSTVPQARILQWRDKLRDLARDHLIVADTSDDISSAPVAAAILAADLLAIPVTASITAYLRTYPEIGGMLEAAGRYPEIVWFGTMIDQRSAVTRYVLKMIADDGVELATLVPRGVAVEEAAIEDRSVVTARPRSKPAIAYVELATKIYARLRRLNGASPMTTQDPLAASDRRLAS